MSDHGQEHETELSKSKGMGSAKSRRYPRGQVYLAPLALVFHPECMLCYVILCYVMLCYVMLCYVMLCMLCYVMLCYVMLCYVMLCYVMLCYVMVRLPLDLCKMKPKNS